MPPIRPPMILVLGSWRQSLVLDGALGLVIAGIDWYTVRSRLREHPGVNAAELALTGNAQGEAPFTASELKQALWIFARNRGNFGASASAMLVPWLLAYGGTGQSGKTLVFCTLAGAFVLARVAALGMDASRPLVKDRPEA